MLASRSCLLTDVVDQLHENSKKVNFVERLTRHLNKGTPLKALHSYLSVVHKQIPVNGMLYSVPYEYFKKKVDVRVTDTTIEIFYNHNHITSHRRLKGCPGQYRTITEHMLEDHQKYLEWNGDCFRKRAERIGINMYTVINAILTSKDVKQQTNRSYRGLLKFAEKYSDAFRNQLDAPKFKEIPFEDQFGMLVDMEYSNRKNNHLKRLIRNAGCDQPEASIMDINYTSRRRLNN